VRLWDVESGECSHTLIGHEKLISAIAYSPRGNLIVSWAVYGEAMLWDVETGECRWTLDYDTTQSTLTGLRHNLVWMSSDVDAFITGDSGGSVKAWDVTGEGDQCRVHMRWTSTNGQLMVEDACIQDVKGLSHLNTGLLKQRGAVGDPVIRLGLREASKKVIAMTSVVSKLKSSSNAAALNSPSPSAADLSTTHSEKHM
jgi:WD40 repeat protein